jgi:glycosyltransferase involved in cell wall biosynthesis
MRTRGRPLRILIGAPAPPAFDRESGARRIWDIVLQLRELGHELTYCALEAWSDDCYESALRELRVPTLYGIGEGVQRFLSSQRIDCAFIHFWRAAEVYLPLIRLRAPGTKIIIDSVDVHFLREARQRLIGAPENGSARIGRLQGIRIARELNVYRLADAVLTVSDKERCLLTDYLGDKVPVVTVPDCEDIVRAPQSHAGRAGVLFSGNFWHKPNLDAVEHFVRDIWCEVPEALRRLHPFRVVGNGLPVDSATALHRHPQVEVIGWAESLEPHYARARVAVAPLRFGAGTKRKILQSLAAGTPTVCTSMAVEGFDCLRNGVHLLVSNDPNAFAGEVVALLLDTARWARIAHAGQDYVGRRYSRRRLAKCLRALLASLASRPTARVEAPLARALYRQQIYARSVAVKVGRLVRERVASGACIVAIHDGSLDALRAGASRVEHWSSGEPNDLLCSRLLQLWSAHCPLLIVAPAGVLDRLLADDALREALAPLERQVFDEVPFGLLAKPLSSPVLSSAPIRNAVRTAAVSRLFDFNVVTNRRPAIGREGETARDLASRSHRVLVVGAYLAHCANNIDDIVRVLGSSARHAVTQRWASLSGSPPTGTVARVTTKSYPDLVSKWSVANALLDEIDASCFDYILVVDDDIVLPEGFLDCLLPLQEHLNLAVAQPARTSNSFIDHPIVEQQQGTIARQTWFVESGPVVSFRTDALRLLRPFDERSPMGWGYSNNWAYELRRSGLLMGIIDAVPVDHGLRAPARHYCRISAQQQRDEFLSQRSHLTYDDCYRVERVATDLRSGAFADRRLGARAKAPVISVIVPTHDRPELLAACLDSLARQSLHRSRYEVIVVDDGSSVNVRPVVESYRGFRLLRISHAGRGAARNVGLFAAAGALVHFFDDDDVAEDCMLEEHVAAHRANPATHVAVLGYTSLAASVQADPLMHYVTQIGQNLFSYPTIANKRLLDFRYFWGGRVSCKKSFLSRHGIHNQNLSYYVDIELAYRLSLHGLMVLYAPQARSQMLRSISLRDFCVRCEAKGEALSRMGRVHADAPRVQEYCNERQHLACWQRNGANLSTLFQVVQCLHDQAVTEHATGRALEKLHHGYRDLFSVYTAKGYVAARTAAGSAQGMIEQFDA